jgi:hypothetical protein
MPNTGDLGDLQIILQILQMQDSASIETLREIWLTDVSSLVASRDDDGNRISSIRRPVYYMEDSIEKNSICVLWLPTEYEDYDSS